ncbi:MAG: hypothetical protein QOJ39_1130 [Candidatus Eremiobacteraeota bacterium]|jgi:hypothetical protein|nr:hypothetical protein [Candidatus Eremiobacteraeota bacterium]
MGEVIMIPGVSFLVQDRLFNAQSEPEQPRYASPPKRNTKATGDISEARVLAALVEAGYWVSRPFGENQRYDLVIDDGVALSRVQVKTGRLRAGVIVFNCCSTHGHRRSAVTTRPYTGQIELLAVYCPETEKVYLLPEADLTRSKIQLRVVPARNNQLKMIRWASTYELA